MDELQTTRTVQLPPLSLRADLGPRSVDEADRSVELIFTTGAQVRRRDFWTGKEYLEVLSLNSDHIRLDRLNDGAPLLDSHSAFSVSDQLGAVVPGSVALMRKAVAGRVRFSRRDSVDGIWQDVQDGLIRNVSIGYRVYRFEEKTPKGPNALPVRTAVDWEPFEVSMVPVAADSGAKVRGGEVDTNSCDIVAIDCRSADPPPGPPAPQTDPEPKAGTDPAPNTEESKMDPKTQRSETIVADPNLTPADPPPAPPEPNEHDQGAESERTRIQGILLACRSARLPQSFADQLIADKTALVDAQTRVFEELNRRDVQAPNPGPSRVQVVGEDPFVHIRSGIENALLHRCYPKQQGDGKGGFELSDEGKTYRGMTLLRIAEAFLTARGVRTTGMSKMELAGLALGLNVRGMHTTSDFADLLADVSNKTLRASYEAAPQTFTPISRMVTLPDFKPVNRVQIGEAPQLLAVDEHGEFKRGTIGEGKEQFQLATYGRVFAITRKALVNDDTDAFSRVATLFGRAARNLESNLVWAQVTSNPTMGDGTALFHADHGNLDSIGDQISIDAIGEGRAAMRLQTGLDGETLLNIMPRFLIVPAALETTADQFVSQNLNPNQASQVNPFAGRLQVIAEPRLDTDSVTAWYLGATPDQVDIIEYGFLEGEAGPVVESRLGFDIDGLEVKARHDFAAKVIDHRGLFKNVGAT